MEQMEQAEVTLDEAIMANGEAFAMADVLEAAMLGDHGDELHKDSTYTFTYLIKDRLRLIQRHLCDGRGFRGEDDGDDGDDEPAAPLPESAEQDTPAMAQWPFPVPPARAA